MQQPTRRAFCIAAAGLAAAPASPAMRQFTVVTFGDSVLDCGRYNPHGIQPGALVVRNDDALFPKVRGQDLASRGPALLRHCAVDGATVDDLDVQLARAGTLQAPLAIIGTVYDPTFGDDSKNFLGVDAGTARRNHERVNGALREAAGATAHGVLVDLHAHFLRGDPSWFTQTIEPSLKGASEVRRGFLREIVKLVGAGVPSPQPSPRGRGGRI